MSEQEVREGFGDLAVQDTRLCDRCASEGENALHRCDPDSIRVVSISVVRDYTESEARAHIVRYYGEGADTPERMERQMGSPFFTNSTIEVCDEWIQNCEWCSESYVIGQDTDNTYTGMYRSSMSYPHEDLLCRGCSDEAYVCDRCQVIAHGDEISTVNYDYVWCEMCTNDAAEWCEDCEMYFRRNHHDCPSDDGSGSRIHDYSYRPTPDFRWIEETDGDLSDYRLRSRTPFMGFELEVEFMNSESGTVLDRCDKALESIAYYKHDGSLDYGFEIVTHPMTLAAHKQLIDWSFLRDIADMGCRSWSAKTCGLHIHISRSAFVSQKHLAMFQFLFLNNQDAMVTIAGRSDSRWATFDGVKQYVIPAIKGTVWRNRYEAINVTNPDTVELRLFRGTLKASRVMVALELVDAAFRYTRTMTAHDYIDGAADFARFAAWFMAREEYENLTNFTVDNLTGYIGR